MVSTNLCNGRVARMEAGSHGTGAVHACFSPGCDMAWIAPREHAPRLLGQASLHRDCTTLTKQASSWRHRAKHRGLHRCNGLAAACATRAQ